jgi:hypothetical protein
VNELNETWEMVLAQAERQARAAGRGEVADYVALRVANDLARQTGVDWLLNTFSGLAGEANRVGAGVTIERTAKHRFMVGAATMVGELLTFRYGVRSLTVAAGWPRAPGDGFVRGGGLACARIQHFGMPKANEELLLARAAPQAPRWFAFTEENTRQPFPAASARWHIGKFLGVN